MNVKLPALLFGVLLMAACAKAMVGDRPEPRLPLIKACNVATEAKNLVREAVLNDEIDSKYFEDIEEINQSLARICTNTDLVRPQEVTELRLDVLREAKKLSDILTAD